MSDIKNIVIIDDHTMVRRGLAALINLFPKYKVIYDAANGRDYIKQQELHPVPDIVLMDIAMPEMDGYTTTAWINDHYPQIKVLALSTMESEEAVIKMIRCGARGYLFKDAEPGELKKAFDEVLSLGYYYNDLVSRKIIQSVNNHTGKSTEVNPFSKLTDRELTFLKLACSEKTYYEIAKEMIISERTVDGYRDSLFKKLQVSTRVGLVLYAIRNGIMRV